MKKNDRFNILFHAVICLLAAFYILVAFYGFYLEKRVSDAANGIPSLLMIVPACAMMLNLALFFFTARNTDGKSAITCVIVSLVALAAADAIGILYFSTRVSLFRVMEIAVFAVFTVNSALVQTGVLRLIDRKRRQISDSVATEEQNGAGQTK